MTGFVLWRRPLLAWLALSAVIAACGSDELGSETDEPGPDDAESGASGEGTTNTPSSGSGGRSTGSGGTGGTKAGAGGQAGSTQAGASAAGAAGCGPRVLPGPPSSVQASCSPEYRSCLDAAMSSEAAIACEDAEDDRCLRCQNDAIYHCSTQHGCADEYGAYFCCVAAQCPDPSDAACAQRAMTDFCRAQSNALLDCAVGTVVAATCPILDPLCIDANTGGAGGVGNCVGTATTNGQVASAALPARHAYTQEDAGGIGILLTNTPLEGIPSGERALLLRLQPIDDQLSYPPTSGLAQCGVIAKTMSGWAPVSEFVCDMTLSVLEYASAPNTCDGSIAGVIAALPGASTFSATFDAPLTVARSQIMDPSCLPTDSLCASNDACCSNSCSLALGRCN